MDDATGRPRRMRYSFETRCRAVAAMLTGASPGAAAQAVGAARTRSGAGPVTLGALLGARPRRWARCCSAGDAPAGHGSRDRPSCATSGPSPASCCTWTPRSWPYTSRTNGKAERFF